MVHFGDNYLKYDCQDCGNIYYGIKYKCIIQSLKHYQSIQLVMYGMLLMIGDQLILWHAAYDEYRCFVAEVYNDYGCTHFGYAYFIAACNNWMCLFIAVYYYNNMD
eukprot:211666_1